MSESTLLRSLKFPTVLVTVTLAGWVVIRLAVAWTDLQRMSLLDAEVLDPGRLTRNEDLGETLALAQWVTLAPAAVAFIVWLWMARTNTEIISDQHHRWSRLWVILGWIIPFLNLWVPKQVVNDVWRASDPGQLDDEEPRSSLLITLWWTLYLGYVLAERVGSALPERTWLSISLALTPVALAAAALATVIALRITRLHQDHATRITAAFAGPV